MVVKFSLVDTRPLHGMADVCQKHGLKLLTYGTLVWIIMHGNCFILIYSSLVRWLSIRQMVAQTRTRTLF